MEETLKIEDIKYPALKQYALSYNRIKKVAQEHPEEIKVLEDALKEAQNEGKKWFDRYHELKKLTDMLTKNMKEIGIMKEFIETKWEKPK